MSDLLRIEMIKEYPAVVEDGEIIEAEQADGYEVYACVDSIRAWIGYCTDIESLEEIASPENLVQSLIETCSEIELDCLMSCLKFNGYKYDFFDEIKTAIKDEE